METALPELRKSSFKLMRSSSQVLRKSHSLRKCIFGSTLSLTGKSFSLIVCAYKTKRGIRSQICTVETSNPRVEGFIRALIGQLTWTGIPEPCVQPHMWQGCDLLASG